MLRKSTSASLKIRLKIHNTQRRGGNIFPPFLFMAIHLSPRLLAAAALVPVGSDVIDVGTDHAKLPVYLVQNGIARHVWACDIHAGPLENARSLVRAEGLEDRIGLRLTDGLHGFSRADADTVTITGMGGETIVDILAAAPWVHENVVLVLGPHTKMAECRRWLCVNGFTIDAETLVEDAGRIYPLFTAVSGTPVEYTTAEYHSGLFSALRRHPLFADYLDRLIARASAAAPYNAEEAVLCRDYITMKENLSS